MSDISATLTMLSPVMLSSSAKQASITDASSILPIEIRSAQTAPYQGVSLSISRYSPAYGDAKQIRQVDFSNPALADAGSKQLLHNVTRGSVVGGAMRLSDLVQRGDVDYQQDMRQYTTFSFPTKNGEYPPLDLTTFEDASKNVEQDFRLQLKTKDGDTINFSFQRYEGFGITQGDTQADERGVEITDKRSSAFAGAEIEFSVEGTLSNDEKQQLDLLAQKLESLTTGYYDHQEMALNQFDFTEFDLMEQVNLSFDQNGSEVLSVHYTDTYMYRTIEVELGGATADMTIDKTSVGMSFNADQQADAKQAYMALLLEGATEAKSRKDATMMQAVFEMSFNHLAPEPEATDTPARNSIQLNEQAASSLVGLPDFDFNYQSSMARPNWEAQPGEYQGFTLSLSLDSIVSDNKSTGKTDIVQTQKYDIKGAYYEPLDHLDSVDFEHQNYQYTEFARTAEKVSHLLLQEGAIKSLLVAEEGEAQTNTKVYEEGRLVDEIKEITEFSALKNHTELALEQKREQDRDMLNALVIDPYEKHERPDKRGIVALDGAVEWLRSDLGHVLNHPQGNTSFTIH